jgi:hypothetical protein
VVTAVQKMAASMTGWRFWFVSSQPQSRGVLIGPCQAIAWRPGRDFQSWCSEHPDHVPPVEGCDCAVHANKNVVDTRMWMRLVRHRMRAEGQFPFYVLGRVTLYDVVEVATVKSSRPGDALWGGRDLKANRARIEELFIYDDADLPRNYVRTLHALLSAAWDVPVSVGEPPCTAAQWAGKLFSDSVCEEFGLFSPFVDSRAGRQPAVGAGVGGEVVARDIARQLAQYGAGQTR